MKASILICTYNRAELLKEALDSLVQLEVPSGLEWEALIVDNNSNDSTKAIIHSFCEKYPGRFRYIFEGRQGKSFALNAGVREAKGEVVAFTDDDATVDPHWLTQLIDTMERFHCAGVGGKIVPVWKIDKPSWLEMEGPFKLMDAIVSFDLGDQPCQMKKPAFGANMALRKAILEKYGDYRLDLCRRGDLLGGEDTEYCRRVLKGGDQLFYAPGAIVFHPVEEKRTHKSYFEEWYFCRGRAAIREDGVPQDAVRYFKVPRYMLRILWSRVVKWFFSPNPKLRFHNKLEIYEMWGQILESRTALKAGK
jgi:glucosyl-dolichyl phosphate glucuronosyltransferase